MLRPWSPELDTGSMYLLGWKITLLVYPGKHLSVAFLLVSSMECLVVLILPQATNSKCDILRNSELHWTHPIP